MHINSNDLNNFQNEEMNTATTVLTSLWTNIQIMHPQLPPI